MKVILKRIIAILVVFAASLSLLGCAAIYKITAPSEYKNGLELYEEYPEAELPVYPDSTVFEIGKSGESILLKAGSPEAFKDIVDFYSDYFYDNDITLYSEKDRSSEYLAEGESGSYEFEIAVGTPSGKWEERLFSAVIEIEVKKVNIPNKKELNAYMDLLKADFELIESIYAKSDEMDESTEDDFQYYSDVITDVLSSISQKTDELSQRQVPGQADFEKLGQTETELFALLYDIFDEYGKIVDYADLMLDIGEEMEYVGAYNSSDTYELYSMMDEALYNSIVLLEDFPIPSYIEDFNNNVIKIFGDMRVSLDYCLYAIDLYDSIRLDAGEYSFDILLRELDKVMDGFNNDLDVRYSKIDEELSHIKDISEGLVLWIDDISADIDSDAEALSPFPEELMLGDEKTIISCDYLYPDEIIPANYRSLDYVSFIQLSTNRGEADVKVSVEIPGFTQKFEQKVTVSRAETEIIVHPPLLQGAIESLNSNKDAQLIVTVENLETGELVVQDTKDILLYSRYDMQWVDEGGTSYIENILAWVTPEAPQISELIRVAADSAEYLSGGVFDSIIGYQGFSDWYDYEITYIQAAAIMHALATTMNVKYVMEPFSTTNTIVQRVKTPTKVLDDEGGLCAETAVTVASALQAMGMHSVLILLPGHMQAAVETWYGSGEYFLIETTALSSAANENFDNVIYYYTPDDWAEYLSWDGYTAIDCELAEHLGIKSVN